MAVLMLGIIAAGASVPAGAGTAGSINGRVYEAATGAPVAGVRVLVLRATTHNGAPAFGSPPGSPAFTRADGSYTVPNLAWGSNYRIGVEATRDYATTWYVGGYTRVDGTNITVHEDQATHGINLAMRPGAHIRGQVTGAGRGVAGIEVVAFPQDGSANMTPRAVTDVEGHYDLGPVDPATYVVRANDSATWAGEYWQGASTPAAADRITLTSPGQVRTGVNLTLVPTGRLSGRIRFDGTTTPVSGGAVHLREKSDDPWTWHSGKILSDGSFVVAGVPPGEHLVHLNAQGAVEEYWRDSDTEDGATLVRVGSDATTTIEASVAPSNITPPPPPPVPGQVSGKVTDAQGNPLGGVVSVTGSGHRASIQPDGTYLVRDVAPGPQRVCFNPDSSDFLRECYLDADIWTEHTPVTVVSGQTTTGIDAVLEPGAELVGTVVDGEGDPVGGAAIQVESPRPDNGLWEQVGGARADEAGRFRVRELPADLYSVQVHPVDRPELAPTWLGDVFSRAESTKVRVATGEIRSGLQVRMLQAARVHGLFTVGGVPRYGIRVERFLEGAWKRSPTVIHENGSYEVDNLLPGAYRLTYYCEPQWFPYGQPVIIRRPTLVSGQTLRLDVTVSPEECVLETEESADMFGSTRIGRLMRVDRGEYAPDPRTVRINWWVGNQLLASHKPYLRMQEKYRGKRITAVIVAQRPGYPRTVYRERSTRSVRW